MSSSIFSKPTSLKFASASKLEKYQPPVQAKPGTTKHGNGLTDLIIKNSKGEELVFSGKNLMKGTIENINILGENHKFVKVLDSEGEKGVEGFNGVMIAGIAAVPAGIASIMAVNAIAATASPGVKFAVVAGATIAAGVGMSKLFYKDSSSKDSNAVDNSAEKGVKIDYAPVSKGKQNLEAGLGIGFGAVIGGAFGSFISIPLASTGAFSFGATVVTVVAAGVITGGTLGYLASKSK